MSMDTHASHYSQWPTIARKFLAARVHILVGDICQDQVDAIVNAANYTMRGGGGVDGTIMMPVGRKSSPNAKHYVGCGILKVSRPVRPSSHPVGCCRHGM